MELPSGGSSSGRWAGRGHTGLEAAVSFDVGEPLGFALLIMGASLRLLRFLFRWRTSVSFHERGCFFVRFFGLVFSGDTLAYCRLRCYWQGSAWEWPLPLMLQLNSLLFLGSVNSWPACGRLAAHNNRHWKSILEYSSWPFSEKIISIFDSQEWHSVIGWLI